MATVAISSWIALLRLAMTQIMKNQHLSILSVLILVVVVGYAVNQNPTLNVFAQYKTIAQINAMGHEPTWWERLVIEDGPPLVVLYALLTIPTWIASILARSSSWYAGGIIGAVLGVLLGQVLSSVVIALGGAVALALIGLLLDHHISAHYNHRIANDLHPHWWAGGRHGGKLWKHITG